MKDILLEASAEGKSRWKVTARPVHCAVKDTQFFTSRR